MAVKGFFKVLLHNLKVCSFTERINLSFKVVNRVFILLWSERKKM